MDWLTRMARHRRQDPDKPPPTHWYICQTLRIGEGCAVPSNLRNCGGHTGRGCGCQVLVPVFMDELVESGELVPRCWDCQCDAGTSVMPHPREIAYLGPHAQLGWDLIAEMNEWLAEQRLDPPSR
jgi:hypothetical protein